MSHKMYVGNLSYGVQEANLEDLFKSAGTVVSVKIVRDMNSGRSKGFGFVEMSTEEELDSAIEQFNGQDLDGRQLKLDKARPPQKREGGSFRGGPRGGDRGGRGGGRGFGGGDRGGRGGRGYGDSY